MDQKERSHCCLICCPTLWTIKSLRSYSSYSMYRCTCMWHASYVAAALAVSLAVCNTSSHRHIVNLYE